MAKTSAEINEKPRVFIGSSVEGLHIANNIQLLLEHTAEPTVWTQGVFEATGNTLDDLIDLLDRTDFGIFVFSPDDISKIRKQRFLVARDNVIFEMGLFIGRIGKKRTFYIIPRYREKFHIPSDLIGVMALDYDNNRSDGNIQAALGSPCTKIIERINQLGRFESQTKVGGYSPNLGQESSIFSNQQESEFNYIYEQLNSIRDASISVYKEVIEDDSKKRKNVGICKLKYSLLNIIRLNINNKMNVFEGRVDNFLNPHSKRAQEVCKSKLSFFDSNHSFGYSLKPDENNLSPLLRKFGLLEEKTSESNVRVFGTYKYYVYSEKMFKFIYWLDFHNKTFDNESISFAGFIQENN